MRYFTPEQDAVIIEHKTTIPEIAKAIGKTPRQVTDRAKYLRRKGIGVARRAHEYTPEDDEYILAKWGTMKAKDIAEHLGVSLDGARNREARLRAQGREFAHKRKTGGYQQEAHREIIRDGYPDVPWWMRQSTRCQYFAPYMYSHEDNQKYRLTQKENRDLLR